MRAVRLALYSMLFVLTALQPGSAQEASLEDVLDQRFNPNAKLPAATLTIQKSAQQTVDEAFGEPIGQVTKTIGDAQICSLDIEPETSCRPAKGGDEIRPGDQLITRGKGQMAIEYFGSKPTNKARGDFVGFVDGFAISRGVTMVETTRDEPGGETKGNKSTIRVGKNTSFVIRRDVVERERGKHEAREAETQQEYRDQLWGDLALYSARRWVDLQSLVIDANRMAGVPMPVDPITEYPDEIDTYGRSYKDHLWVVLGRLLPEYLPINALLKPFTKNWGFRSAFTAKTGTSLCGIRGTKFSVSRSPEKSQMQVAVKEGNVVCRAPGAGETKDFDINAGLKLTFAKNKVPELSDLTADDWSKIQAQTRVAQSERNATDAGNRNLDQIREIVRKDPSWARQLFTTYLTGFENGVGRLERSNDLASNACSSLPKYLQPDGDLTKSYKHFIDAAHSASDAADETYRDRLLKNVTANAMLRAVSDITSRVDEKAKHAADAACKPAHEIGVSGAPLDDANRANNFSTLASETLKRARERSEALIEELRRSRGPKFPAGMMKTLGALGRACSSATSLATDARGQSAGDRTATAPFSRTRSFENLDTVRATLNTLAPALRANGVDTARLESLERRYTSAKRNYQQAPPISNECRESADKIIDYCRSRLSPARDRPNTTLVLANYLTRTNEMRSRYKRWAQNLQKSLEKAKEAVSVVQAHAERAKQCAAAVTKDKNEPSEPATKTAKATPEPSPKQNCEPVAPGPARYTFLLCGKPNIFGPSCWSVNCSTDQEIASFIAKRDDSADIKIQSKTACEVPQPVARKENCAPKQPPEKVAKVSPTEPRPSAQPEPTKHQDPEKKPEQEPAQESAAAIRCAALNRQVDKAVKRFKRGQIKGAAKDMKRIQSDVRALPAGGACEKVQQRAENIGIKLTKIVEFQDEVEDALSSCDPVALNKHLRRLSRRRDGKRQILKNRTLQRLRKRTARAVPVAKRFKKANQALDSGKIELAESLFHQARATAARADGRTCKNIEETIGGKLSEIEELRELDRSSGHAIESCDRGEIKKLRKKLSTEKRLFSAGIYARLDKASEDCAKRLKNESCPEGTQYRDGACRKPPRPLAPKTAAKSCTDLFGRGSYESKRGECRCKTGWKWKDKKPETPCVRVQSAPPPKVVKRSCTDSFGRGSYRAKGGKCACKDGWRWKNKSEEAPCIKMSRKAMRADCRRTYKRQYAYTVFKKNGGYFCRFCKDKRTYYDRRRKRCRYFKAKKRQRFKPRPPRRQKQRPRRLPGGLADPRV